VHVVLSEEGALATDTMENDDEGNYSMVVTSLEVSEGQHYWEVEIVGRPEFCHRHTYGWIPHNAGFGFLDIARPTLGVFASLDRF
jgi:hypothetical protein